MNKFSWEKLLEECIDDIYSLCFQEAKYICDEEADLESPPPYHEDIYLHSDGSIEVSYAKVDDSYSIPADALCLIEISPHSYSAVVQEIESEDEFADWVYRECWYAVSAKDYEDRYREASL